LLKRATTQANQDTKKETKKIISVLARQLVSTILGFQESISSWLSIRVYQKFL
jgi:hypothetical protein